MKTRFYIVPIATVSFSSGLLLLAKLTQAETPKITCTPDDGCMIEEIREQEVLAYHEDHVSWPRVEGATIYQVTIENMDRSEFLPLQQTQDTRWFFDETIASGRYSILIEAFDDSGHVIDAKKLMIKL